jgi:two-component system sensor histidine kinase and response regulator WspE
MDASDALQIDPAMLELFQAEMDAHIPVLNQGLLALEKGQAGAADIEAMMRAAHSIKGAARIVGIEPAVRVAHVMEDCFTAAKDKRIALSSDSVDVLLQGVDALQRICSPAEGAARTETTLQELLNRIGLVRDGKATAASSASTDLVAATVRRDEPGITLPAVFTDESLSATRREILDTLSLRPARIQVDFAQVERLSAASLALLVAFTAEAQANEPPPEIESRAVSASVRAVLQVAGLAGPFGLNR